MRSRSPAVCVQAVPHARPTNPSEDSSFASVLRWVRSNGWCRLHPHCLTASRSAPANGSWTAGASTLTAGGSLVLQKSTATTPTTTKQENRQSSSAGVQRHQASLQPRVFKQWFSGSIPVWTKGTESGDSSTVTLSPAGLQALGTRGGGPRSRLAHGPQAPNSERVQ